MYSITSWRELFHNGDLDFKTTILEYMVENFKKGFTGDYGVKLRTGKLFTLCTLECPSFVVIGHPDRTLSVPIAPAVHRVVTGDPVTLTNFHVLNNG